MSESTKAVFTVVAFFCGLGALFVWFARHIPDTPLVWTFRIGLTTLSVVLMFLVIRESWKKDLAPDFLRAFFGNYFERDGMCFVLLPGVIGNSFVMQVVYQNQYDRRAHLRVEINPPFKKLRLSTRVFEGVRVDLSCEGGGVGVAMVKFDVPIQYQGKALKLDVAAATLYQDGRGKLLRFRNGMRVGEADSKGLGTAALTGIALMAGGLVLSRPANIRVMVPVLGESDRGLLEQPHVGSFLIKEETAGKAPILGYSKRGDDKPEHTPVRDLTVWLPGDPPSQVATRLAEVLTESSSSKVKT